MLFERGANVLRCPLCCQLQLVLTVQELKTKSALQLADQYRMARIAVPAISMGVYAYPPDEAVPIPVKTTIDVLRDTKSVQEVRFVVLRHEQANLFSKILHELVNCSSRD